MNAADVAVAALSGSGVNIVDGEAAAAAGCSNALLVWRLESMVVEAAPLETDTLVRDGSDVKGGQGLEAADANGSTGADDRPADGNGGADAERLVVGSAAHVERPADAHDSAAVEGATKSGAGACDEQLGAAPSLADEGIQSDAAYFQQLIEKSVASAEQLPAIGSTRQDQAGRIEDINHLYNDVYDEFYHPC